MAVIRWDPTRDLSMLQGEMNRLFNSVFDSPTGNGQAATRRWIPAMDLLEEEDHLVLRADLPGLSEDDINIELQEGVLTITGERRLENREKQDGYFRVERAHGNFARALQLPDGIDPDAITAEFDRGVLEVRIPKPEERKPRRVSISPGSHKQVVEGTTK